MTNLDWGKVSEILQDLYRSTDALEMIFPGRKFTLDGHLVGSIGEVIAAFMFDLTLNAASTTGHDAIAKDGKRVEIKYTHGKTVAFRHESEHALVLARLDRGGIEVIYNGHRKLAWSECGKMQRNGQRPISIGKLRKLNMKFDDDLRLPLIHEAPL